MIVTYAVAPVPSEVSIATAETGKPPGFIAPRRSSQLPAPPLALGVIQMCPPVGIRSEAVCSGVDHVGESVRILDPSSGHRTPPVDFVSGAAASPSASSFIGEDGAS